MLSAKQDMDGTYKWITLILTYSSSDAGKQGSLKSCLSGERTNKMDPIENRFLSTAVCTFALKEEDE